MPAETPPASLEPRVVHLPLGGDKELQLYLVDGDIDLRLARRAPLGADAEPAAAGPFEPTSAGFRLPAAVAPILAEALHKLARREQQAALWRPASVDTTAGA